jgi:hypothetical protein
MGPNREILSLNNFSLFMPEIKELVPKPPASESIVHFVYHRKKIAEKVLRVC